MSQKGLFTARIVAVRELAPEVRELRLQSNDFPGAAMPGQWLSLQLPVGERPPLVRAYTLANALGYGDTLELCLDRVPGGLGSGYLFKRGVGDELTFGGPLGRFTLPPGETPQLWIARFTGIVPFRAMLQAWERQERRPRVHLLYSVEGKEAAPYWDELQHAAGRHTGFTAEMLPADAGRAVDTVVDAWSRLPVSPLPGNTIPLICGKREFVRPLREALMTWGFERRAVPCESYD